jgi:HNH endonuclease
MRKYRQRGNGSPSSSGYWRIGMNRERPLRHVLVAEKAIGRKLSEKNEVHHVDSNRGNDANQNLVICEDRAYHILLHIRTRALMACGNVQWRKCDYCKIHDNPLAMKFRTLKNGASSYTHSACRNEYERKRVQRKKAILS